MPHIQSDYQIYYKDIISKHANILIFFQIYKFSKITFFIYSNMHILIHFCITEMEKSS